MDRSPRAVSRRQFVQSQGVTSAALAVGCGRVRELAQPRVYRIGWLDLYSRPAWYEAFQQGLREAGYIEGQNVAIHTRNVDGQEALLPALATELATLPVDLLFAPTSYEARAAQSAVQVVPIVFGIASDPVRQGLVASLARPGGNLTGLSVMNTTLSGKRLELLAGSVPNLARVGILQFQDRGSQLDLDETESMARARQIEPLVLQAQSPQDLESQFKAASRQRAGAIVVLPGTGIVAAQIAALAAQYRLPAMYPQREFVQAGGLMSYGPNFPESFRRAANYYVDKILKGAQPADLPVEQPTKFEFVINLKAAQALGLTIPQQVLLQATEVLS